MNFTFRSLPERTAIGSTASTPKLPANYRTVLDAVETYVHGRHATAAEIYRAASALRPGIGFTTVHRALARLHALGLICKLDISGEDAAMYEPITSPHAHFRCTVCGTVADVDYACDPAALEALQAAHGLRIECETITFAGRCRDCCAAPAPR
jgi:Fur family ferric uptake transcriptional regulator